jgi:hypothetical protein
MNEQWRKNGCKKKIATYFFPQIGFDVVVSNLALAQLVAGPTILIIEIGFLSFLHKIQNEYSRVF